MGGVLVWRGRAAEPGVVGDVDQEIGAGAAIAARQVLERRLVADQHTEAADPRPIDRQIPPGRKAAGPARQPRHAAKPAHGDERHALDHGHQIVLLVNRPGSPGASGVIKEGRVVAAVRAARQPLHMQPADQDRRVAFPREPRDGIVPRGLLIEPAGERRLGPKDDVGSVLRPHPPRQLEQLRHDAVRLARPLLVVPLVRLDHADEPDFPRREGAHPPRPVPPCERHRREHRDHRPPPQRPTPHSPRGCQRHVAPGEPQRHPARAREVGPLHQDRRIRQRRPEAEPRESDVPQMADDPLQRRPRDRKHESEGHGRQPEPQADDEPKQRAGQPAEDRDGREVAERGERREVPQGHDHPVEHEPEARHAVPEAAAERPARVPGGDGVEHEQDSGGDGDEADWRESERRVARQERERAQGGQGSRAAAAHRITSRPSSAER